MIARFAQKLEKEKNCTTEATILHWEKLWTEVKTSWGQVTVKTAHPSGAKTLVNYRKVYLKNFGNFCLRVSQHQSFCTWSFSIFGSTWCFWKFLVLPNCRARKYWWTIEEVSQKDVESFLSAKKFSEGALLVFF